MGGETCQTSQPPSHSPLKTWEDHHHIYLVFILGGGAHLKMHYGAGPVGMVPPVNVTKLGRANHCSTTAWCCVLQGHVLEPITPPLIHILGLCSPPLIHILGCVLHR